MELVMKSKIAIHIAGMTVVAILFLLLLGFEETRLENLVEPVAGMRLPAWLADFRFWGRAGIVTSLIAGFVWYVVAQWKFKIDRLKDRQRRLTWALLFLLPGAATLAAVYFTKPVQAGAWLANVFYCLNSLAVYYLETALFSPVAFKYAPLFAQKVRFWDRALTTSLRRDHE
jgi:hypothetical protein